MFQRRLRKDRKGTAATEFALVLPVLLILTFGTLEICSAIFLRQTVKIASHEGARVAIRKRATTDDVVDVVEEFLEDRDITGATITVNPAPETTNLLLPITVTVRVPMAGNGILPNAFYTWFSDKDVDGRTVMYKEFIHPDLEAALAAGS